MIPNLGFKVQTTALQGILIRTSKYDGVDWVSKLSTSVKRQMCPPHSFEPCPDPPAGRLKRIWYPKIHKMTYVPIYFEIKINKPCNKSVDRALISENLCFQPINYWPTDSKSYRVMTIIDIFYTFF